MAIARIGTPQSFQADLNPQTPLGYDTSGASLLVAFVSAHTSGAGGTVLDTNGNTYIAITSGDIGGQFWYAQGPGLVLGANHRARYQGASENYATIVFAAYTGAHASAYASLAADALQASGTTVQPGSLTAPEAGCLFVTGVGLLASVASGGMSVNEGFSTIYGIDNPGSATRGAFFADKVQTTAGAQNPTWTSAVGNAMRACQAVFKPGTGAPVEPAGPAVVFPRWHSVRR